ncbi:MAG: hypothetical protein J3K34DRAFT_178713 [Monoraphidium minutum]|nr:MAG: hypothetical protein J3K34DRAFT_178713 [Monoraphidium minutum]
MARTRGAARRERQPGPKGPQPEQASEVDSTMRCWGISLPPKRRHRRTRTSSSGGEVPWLELPECALYTVFEALRQDKEGAMAFRSAAACCRTWRVASMEVLLDDTAASRPELPPMMVPEVETREPTSATTCNAGLCDEAESETEVNGFEASSREMAKRKAGAAAGGRGGGRGGCGHGGAAGPRGGGGAAAGGRAAGGGGPRSGSSGWWHQ